ncbi:MAG: hypothetical protein ABI661_01335 [Gammaproteobacteria bacterium]
MHTIPCQTADPVANGTSPTALLLPLLLRSALLPALLVPGMGAGV